MDFFEELKERANKRTWCKNSFWRKRRQEGIDATIEALKEMMVGEPIRGRLNHDENPYKKGDMLTWVWTSDMFKGERCSLLAPGHHGTDGEEVAVLVIRMRE